MVKRAVLVLMNLAVFESVIAQQGIVGKIDGYKDGKGLIISYDFVTGDKYTWGTIDDKGLISVPLSDDFLDQIKKMAKKAQKKAPEGFKLKLPTVEDAFSCRYPDIEFEHPLTILSGLPDLKLTDKKKKAANGNLYAVNNPLIAEWLHRCEKGDIGLGYYLLFYFADETASAKGKCISPTFTGLGEENYDKYILFDIDLKKGWNIVQYKIEEIFESKVGGTFPKVIKVTKLENLPVDLLWISVI